MKYRVNINGADDGFDVITEDGDVVSLHHNGDNWVSTYYGTRLYSCDANNYVWDELSQGSVYLNDWDHEPTVSEAINDALTWMVFPAPAEGWQQDDSIWGQFFD